MKYHIINLLRVAWPAVGEWFLHVDVENILAKDEDPAYYRFIVRFPLANSTVGLTDITDDYAGRVMGHFLLTTFHDY